MILLCVSTDASGRVWRGSRFAQKNAAATVSRSLPLLPSEQPKLFCLRLVQFLHRVHQVLMSLLQRIKFLLLVRVEQRPDLRSGVVHYGLGFLHRIFVNGDDLRPSLIDDRLNLRLLIGRESQRLGQVFERKSVAVPGARSATESAVFILRNGEAAKRDGADSSECK